MQNTFSISLAFTVILGSISSAQQPVFPSMSMSGTGDTMTVTFRGPARFMMPVTGNPYSADQISEHTQTLSDGTHITQNNTTQHLFRDSQGRTRTERPMMMGPIGQNASGWPAHRRRFVRRARTKNSGLKPLKASSLKESDTPPLGQSVRRVTIGR